jgi:hypothetical protein
MFLQSIRSTEPTRTEMLCAAYVALARLVPLDLTVLLSQSLFFLEGRTATYTVTWELPPREASGISVLRTDPMIPFAPRSPPQTVFPS